jgi:recombination protein RecT
METKQETTKIKKQELTPAVRFTEKVMSAFQSNVGEIEVTESQKGLIQNYFISIDAMLKQAETKRAMTTSKKNDKPLSWQNVNMEKLAVDVMAYSKLGINPLQPNHLHFIPFNNSKSGLYDVNFMLGYNGIKIKAIKYGVESEMPKNIVVKLVYSGEKFVPHWKDVSNPVEKYEHIPSDNPFDDSKEVIGGYWYKEFEDETKNKLKIFTKKDIEKRKPKYASAEFWGGEKDEWVGGKKTGNKIKVDGWYEEMAEKTIIRNAYGSIPIDNDKIDETYLHIKQNEIENAFDDVAVEVVENANKTEIGFSEDTQKDDDTKNVNVDGKLNLE